MARDKFSSWAKNHRVLLDAAISESIANDHPSDAQGVALARKHLQKRDQIGLDPALV
jgi:hypothetical protein